MIRYSSLVLALLIVVTCLAACSEDDSTSPNNNAPTITGLVADPPDLGVGEAAVVTCTAEDEDGDSLTYTWSASSGALNGSGAAVTWTAPDEAGTGTVTCTVSDGQDSAVETVDIAVEEEVVPGTMVAVPGGTFTMGDAFAEGSPEELPVHSVVVGDFMMGKYELTQAEWALFMDPADYGTGSGPTHPVHSVSWFQVLMFCNYKSLDEGLTPCYSIAGGVDPDLWPTLPQYPSDPTYAAWNGVECNWSADGYRMPTEAEWEYAARGGAAHTDGFRYSGGQTAPDVAWFGDNAPASCQAVGGKMPNQLGIYDMSGNVYEMCWDWFGGTYYTTCNDLGTVTDPTGPETSDMRVVRGGAWGGVEANCRVAGRFRDYPVSGFNYSGVRLVRKP